MKTNRLMLCVKWKNNHYYCFFLAVSLFAYLLFFNRCQPILKTPRKTNKLNRKLEFLKNCNRKFADSSFRKHKPTF